MDILKWLLTACLMLALVVLGIQTEPKKTPEQDDTASITALSKAA